MAFPFTINVDEDKLIVLASSTITSISQLNGKSIAVIPGTSEYLLLLAYEAENNVKFKIVLAPNDAACLALLTNKTVEAWLQQTSIAASEIANSAHPSLYSIVGPALNSKPVALMLRKQDSILNGYVNTGLLEIFEEEIYKIYRRWFLSPIPPNFINLNLKASNATKFNWEHPNNLPTESYTL